MSKFKDGDKVAVYAAGIRHVTTIIAIDSSCEEQSVFVKLHNSGAMWVHPKQCRLIKPKKKRRRVWVNFYNYDCAALFNEVDARKHAAANAIEVAVEFVEVRRKKKS